MTEIIHLGEILSHELNAKLLHLDVTVMFSTALFPGDTTCGQRCLYELGMTGIPVYNVRLTDCEKKKCLKSPDNCYIVHGVQCV